MSRHLAEFVRQLPTPAAILDRDLHYLAYSEEWLRAYRLGDQDLVGKHHYEVFPEIGDHEQWQDEHRRALAGETIRREGHSFVRADGSLDVLNYTLTPWRHQDGEIGGIFMYTQIITQQAKVRRQLEEHVDFNHLLFDRSPLGLNLCRMDGLWIESNQAFLDIIGYSSAEADGGLTYWELTPPEYGEAEKVQLQSLKETGRYGPYEKEFIRKDGTRIPVLLNGFIVERDGEKYIWSVIEDLRARRSLEAEIGRERLKAIHASKLATLGEMAAGFAHEINNPLAIIDGYAYKLRQLISSGRTELVDEAVDAIRGSVSRAVTIVQGLRKFTRQDDAPGLVDAPVGRLIESTLDLCRERLRSRGVELRLDVRTQKSIRCNQIELQQVLINLLNNAGDAAREGREHWIELGARELPGSRIEIRICDSGPGVVPEALGRLFEPFYTTKPVGEGTGLGLSISRSIVEGLKGELRHEPRHEHTCFVIELPAGRATESGENGPNVVYIDDEPSLCRLFELTFVGNGFRVETFSDPEAAINFINQGTTALVLCDYRMPQMTGLDLLSQLDDPAPRFYLVSGDLTLDMEKDPRVMGLVCKPPDPHELLNIIQEAVNACR